MDSHEISHGIPWWLQGPVSMGVQNSTRERVKHPQAQKKIQQIPCFHCHSVCEDTLLKVSVAPREQLVCYRARINFEQSVFAYSRAQVNVHRFPEMDPAHCLWHSLQSNLCVTQEIFCVDVLKTSASMIACVLE